MLDALIKIGKMLGNERDEWDDFVDYPDVSKEESKNTALYILEVVFDLDSKTVSEGQLFAYDQRQAKNFRNLKIKGGNNKSVYITVDARKNFDQLRKTFFGKVDKSGKEPNKGEFSAFIETDTDLVESDFGLALAEIFKLKSSFDSTFSESEKSPMLKLDGNQKIVLVTTSIKWAEKGYDKTTHFSKIQGFDEYANRKILKLGQITEGSGKPKVCYASGDQLTDIKDVEFSERYNINKMFVTTTKNFASDFSDKDFIKNYQVSAANQTLLARGSSFVLEKLKTRIAGIDHCILPQFRHATELGENIFENINGRVDLLFSFQKVMETVVEEMEDHTEDVFWITFLGFESDGNFFKTINIIQDVNSLYLRQVQKAFMQTNKSMTNTEGVPWESIMTVGKEKQSLLFNFFTLYSMIPVRVDKEKRNVALTIFKSILEKRQIGSEVIFEHFKELILCHWYGRWEAYKNIYKNENFDFACRDAVFKYLAFIQFLKKLNLIKNDMVENQEKITTSVSESTTDAQKVQKQVDDFLIKMDYTTNQSALFYLGRALSQIAYEQVKHKHKNKPILSKINYNGMDLSSIWKLYADLREKIVQYKALYVEFNLGKFSNTLNANNWKISKEEALFYVFSGYSFRTNIEQQSETEL